MKKILVAGITILTVAGALVWQSACSKTSAASQDVPKVIVLGFDGLDHELTTRLMEEGRLPNFNRLAERGSFTPLATAVPPQSPVAWSSFITGMDPGGHGIFDFVHRDAETVAPYLSTSRTEDADKVLDLGGDWQLPLGAGKVELLRHGTPFWDVLEEHGIPTTILKMPANFPPSGTASEELSGMGTPDILGTYGTFTYFTTDPFETVPPDVGGGVVVTLPTYEPTMKARLEGPPNPYRKDGRPVTEELTIHLDPEEDAAKLVLDGHEMVLATGQWSEWVAFDMSLIPTQSVKAICRFYLKQVRPELKLYVTPLNIDPSAPAMPVSHPGDFAGEMAEGVGLFYTQGMPEDTKALSAGVFDRDEFLSQVEITASEGFAQYRWALDRFDGGLLFAYFGHVDLTSHMLWRAMDPEHPLYDAEVDEPYADVIPSQYEELDALVGETLDAVDDDTLVVVMSDHGFSPWRRAFNLNSWLRDEGFMTMLQPYRGDEKGLFARVDWARTQAYGLGLNGLYLNQVGREPQGVVMETKREQLLEEIEERLLAAVDPATGKPAVSRVYITDKYYKDEGYLDIGPDMLVGYAKTVRCSNESALGEVPLEVIEDNADEWSGDHCMDHTVVPGILLTSRPLAQEAPSLDTLAPAILAEMGIPGFPARTGDD